MTLCVSVENQITIAESNLCSFPISFWQNNSASSSVEQFQLLNFIVCVSRSTCEEYSYNFRGHAQCVARGMEGQLGTSAKKQRENVGILKKKKQGGRGSSQIPFLL